jgi:hypothetical protein
MCVGFLSHLAAQVVSYIKSLPNYNKHSYSLLKSQTENLRQRTLFLLADLCLKTFIVLFYIVSQLANLQSYKKGSKTFILLPFLNYYNIPKSPLWGDLGDFFILLHQNSSPLS